MAQFRNKRGLLVTVGFPESAEEIYDQYKAVFKAIKGLEPVQNKLFSQPLCEPLHRVIRHITKINANSLGALIVLVLNGYGNDAMKVARGMFEACVNVCYLQRHPDELQDYFDFFWILRNRQLDPFIRLDPDAAAALRDETARIRTEYARVKSRFCTKSGMLRLSWCKRTIAERSREIGMRDHYSIFYAWASSMHHVDIGGVVTQANGTDADVAPSKKWIHEALITGHLSVLRTLGAFNEVANLGMEAKFRAPDIPRRKIVRFLIKSLTWPPRSGAGAWCLETCPMPY